MFMRVIITKVVPKGGLEPRFLIAHVYAHSAQNAKFHQPCDKSTEATKATVCVETVNYSTVSAA